MSFWFQAQLVFLDLKVAKEWKVLEDNLVHRWVKHRLSVYRFHPLIWAEPKPSGTLKLWLLSVDPVIMSKCESVSHTVWTSLVIRVHWGSLATGGSQDLLVTQASWRGWGRRVRRDHREIRDNWDPREVMDLQEFKDQKVFREQKETMWVITVFFSLPQTRMYLLSTVSNWGSLLYFVWIRCTSLVPQVSFLLILFARIQTCTF